MKKIILKKNGLEIGHAIVADDKAQEMVDIYKDNYNIFPEYEEKDKDGNLTGKIIKPDHSVDVVDLSQDYDTLLAECYAKRIEEYPTLGAQMDAMFHARQGDLSQLDLIDDQIKAVKIKYPKPVKEIQ